MVTRGRRLADASAWQIGVAAGIFVALVSPLVQATVFGVNYLQAFLPGGLISGVLFGAVWAWLTHINRGGAQQP